MYFMDFMDTVGCAIAECATATAAVAAATAAPVAGATAAPIAATDATPAAAATAAPVAAAAEHMAATAGRAAAATERAAATAKRAAATVREGTAPGCPHPMSGGLEALVLECGLAVGVRAPKEERRERKARTRTAASAVHPRQPSWYEYDKPKHNTTPERSPRRKPPTAKPQPETRTTSGTRRGDSGTRMTMHARLSHGGGAVHLHPPR
jgi:hypothetical protein